ncbi:MAG: RNA ligase family protein [Patescibacteria group bacterium]|nr:RNA ligase family protein [Patescibacteria group bacterium]
MIKNFPKIESPFIRKGEPYLVTPEIDPDFEWVFKDEGVLAIDKIDGTNVGIQIKDSKIVYAQNRANPKSLLNIKATRWDWALLEGLNSAIQKNWLQDFSDGVYYGELVGPIINANRHQLDKHYWVPFKYLKEKCAWRSWENHKYPKTFKAINEWFKDGLFSLFTRRMTDKTISAEGLVFYHPSGKMAKLRRDMFDWF